MEFNKNIDHDFMAGVLSNSYNRKMLSFAPVQMSFTQLKADIASGKHCYYGQLTLTPSDFQHHDLGAGYHIWLTCMLGFPGQVLFDDEQTAAGIAASDGIVVLPNILFDDVRLCPTTQRGVIDWMDAAIVSGETSISALATNSYNIPCLTFIGYKINIGG